MSSGVPTNVTQAGPSIAPATITVEPISQVNFCQRGSFCQLAGGFHRSSSMQPKRMTDRARARDNLSAFAAVALARLGRVCEKARLGIAAGAGPKTDFESCRT
jgi:hypothetical protein